MNSDNNRNKHCIPYETPIEPTALARAYVPFQNFCSAYNGEESLVRGTVFPGLYSPYRKRTKKNCRQCSR